MKKIALLFCSLFMCASILFAQHYKKDGSPDMRYKENKSSYSSQSSPYYSSTSTKIPKFSKSPKYSFVAKRDSKGRIERNHSATYQFKVQTGYKNGRPGYIIDHVIPLKRGGCDCPSNMQWQTKAAAEAKDKWE
jgi:hypothetical protein